MDNDFVELIELAGTMGAAIELREERSFAIGLQGMGDPIGSQALTLVWHVTAPGLSIAQRRLLESTFNRIRSARTYPTSSSEDLCTK